MATIVDVAKYICEKSGSITAMKLQKLAYYSQAWHLVWEEKPLFEDTIEAWANGPVSPRLFALHRGQFSVDVSTFSAGNSAALSEDEKSSVDKVLEFYGSYSSGTLSDLTHAEDPWKKARARACADDGDRCTEEIRVSDMAEYYESL